MDSNSFYKTYYGHDKKYLDIILSKNKKKVIYLAGDSTLDNKYWIEDYAAAINGYEKILTPPIMKTDVSYFLNKYLQQSKYMVLNCAVEESIVGSKKNLNVQDKVIRDNIGIDDVLVVSIGGNDIALKSSVKTMYNMVLMMKFSSISDISNGSAWGFDYFVNFFRDEIQSYIYKLISKNKPSTIVICMLYYPDEKKSGGWADQVLAHLSYNHDPSKLQEAVYKIYEKAICEIKIDGVDLIYLPWSKVLDGKDTNDYVERVEPSSNGSEKMASYFVQSFNKKNYGKKLSLKEPMYDIRS